MVLHLPSQNVSGLKRFEDLFILEHDTIGHDAVFALRMAIGSRFLPDSLELGFSQRSVIKNVLLWRGDVGLFPPLGQQTQDALHRPTVMILRVLFFELLECIGVKRLFWYCKRKALLYAGVEDRGELRINSEL